MFSQDVPDYVLGEIGAPLKNLGIPIGNLGAIYFLHRLFYVGTVYSTDTVGSSTDASRGGSSAKTANTSLATTTN